MTRKTIAGLAIVILFLSAGTALARPAAAKIDGFWAARLLDDGDPAPPSLRLGRRNSPGEWSMTMKIDLSELSGFAPDKELTFHLKRDAGTFVPDGKDQRRQGGPGRSISPLIPLSSISWPLKATADHRPGRHPPLHGQIDKAYIQGLVSLGFTEISTAKLVEMAIHGVTLDYIRGPAGAGPAEHVHRQGRRVPHPRRHPRVRQGDQGSRLWRRLDRRAPGAAHPRGHAGVHQGRQRLRPRRSALVADPRVPHPRPFQRISSPGSRRPASPISRPSASWSCASMALRRNISTPSGARDSRT